MEKELTFPEYLKLLRRSCHYRQDYVASRLHVCRQTYSHYETGRIRPSIPVLYRLSQLYGVTVESMVEHMGMDS